MSFKGGWYIVLLILVLLFTIVVNTMHYILDSNVPFILHITLSFVVLILLSNKSKYVILGIKIWCAISIIGGILVLISVGLFLIAGANERIDLTEVLISFLHIFIGSYFYINSSYELSKYLEK